MPIHVAAWIKDLKATHSAPTAKLRLAAIRHLFDWLVTGHVLRSNPALSVRRPRHVVRKGKTPVLDASEVRALLDSISGTSPIDLRDKALIGLMLYSFARIGAVVAMKVEDVFSQNRRIWVRLHEKGGKHHEMPCNHKPRRISFRKLGGSLENAAPMANHASTRTMQRYDRRADEVTLDEVERIRF